MHRKERATTYACHISRSNSVYSVALLASRHVISLGVPNLHILKHVSKDVILVQNCRLLLKQELEEGFVNSCSYLISYTLFLLLLLCLQLSPLPALRASSICHNQKRFRTSSNTMNEIPAPIQLNLIQIPSLSIYKPSSTFRNLKP